MRTDTTRFGAVRTSSRLALVIAREIELFAARRRRLMGSAWRTSRLLPDISPNSSSITRRPVLCWRRVHERAGCLVVAELDDAALDALAEALLPRLAARLGQNQSASPWLSAEGCSLLGLLMRSTV